jgi:hypothetical protein
MRTVGVEDREVDEGMVPGMPTGHKQEINRPSCAMFSDSGISH